MKILPLKMKKNVPMLKIDILMRKKRIHHITEVILKLISVKI